MARMTARGEEASNKREAILEAALRLFAEHGVDSASMADIARAVGITKPTLYHYFSGKIEILEQLMAEPYYSTDYVAEVLRSDAPLEDRLRQLAMDYLDAICTRPDLGHVLLRESLGNAKHSATDAIKKKFVRRYMSRIDVLEACLLSEPDWEHLERPRARLFAEILFDSLSLFWLRRVLVQGDETTESERHTYADGLIEWLLRDSGRVGVLE